MKKIFNVEVKKFVKRTIKNTNTYFLNNFQTHPSIDPQAEIIKQFIAQKTATINLENS